MSASWVRKIIAAVLKAEKAKRRSVGVLLTGNRQIRRLNKRHLGHDYATDVISFGYGEPATFGDLVVSFEMARSFAAGLGIRYREELGRYLVHGMLHLLGYDDQKDTARRRMHRRQETILKEVL